MLTGCSAASDAAATFARGIGRRPSMRSSALRWSDLPAMNLLISTIGFCSFCSTCDLALGIPFEIRFHRGLSQHPPEEAGLDLGPRFVAKLAERAAWQESRFLRPGDHLAAGEPGVEQREQDMRRHVGVGPGSVRR